MNAFSIFTVISKKKQRYLKLKAFLVSLVLHATLFALGAHLVERTLTPTSQKPIKDEKVTIVSLMALQAMVPKTVQEKKVVTKKVSKPVKKDKIVQPKKIVKQKKVVKQKKIMQPKKVAAKKPVMEPTPQQTQPKPQKEEVVSAEAFTPPVQNTEQKIEEKVQEKNLHNSPFFEFEPSELALVRSLIQKALKYPSIAKRLGLEGVVVVSFSLSTTGEVSNLQLVQSSNSSVLDKRALQTVNSLDGEFPHLNKKVDLKIPIAFSLQHS